MNDEASIDTGDTYTHGHHESVLRSHTWRTAENSAGYLLPHLEPGMSLLDVGCGPGTITIDLAARVAPGEVIGIDPSADVIVTAREAKTASGQTNVAFDVGNAYELGFADHTFDVVHAHQVLQHVTDPVAVLAEMKRVARPGGIVAVRDADYAGMFWAPLDPRLDRWLEIYRAVAHHNDAEPDAGRHLLGWARSAGFSEVVSTADTWVFATAEDRRWWGGLWADRVTSSALADQAVGYGIATADELHHVAEAFREWALEDAGWFVVVNAELICRP